MPRKTAENVETIPVGPLGIIAMPGCEALCDKIDKYLVKWRAGQRASAEHCVLWLPARHLQGECVITPLWLR